MKRYFTKDQQEEIYDRDGCCQICGTCENLDKCHHVFYGTHKPIGWKKGDNINGTWNGTVICTDDHRGFHHTAKFRNGKNLKFNRQLLEEKAQERFINENENFNTQL